MSMKAVLFDLDGTLLPMDQDVFVGDYFGRLAAKMQPRGYESKQLLGAIWTSVGAMVKNDGSATNEAVFWRTFSGLYGRDMSGDAPHFEEFYRNEFQLVKQVCGFAPKAARVIEKVKALGLRLVLATNPIFPAIATQSRIRWAGLEPGDFELYTTYENSCFSKPNPNYYLEILGKLGLRPEECAMVGNDVTEDMVAETLGMKVFLLTDCVINKRGEDISRWPNGGFDQLLAFLDALPRL